MPSLMWLLGVSVETGSCVIIWNLYLYCTYTELVYLYCKYSYRFHIIMTVGTGGTTASIPVTVKAEIYMRSATLVPSLINPSNIK